MGQTRRTYDKEFKLSAVKMVTEEGLSVAEVSRDLGISENSLHRWKKKYLEDRDNAFPGKGKLKPEDEEIRRLERELKRVKMERDILKKAISFFSKDTGVKYMFIKENRGNYPLELMCRVLQVSRSGYYNWLKRQLSSRKIEERKLLEIIRFHYNRSDGRYGSPRITASIRRNGIIVNRKKVARLMRQHNIRAKTKKRYKTTTRQNRKAEASENLVKGNFRSEEKDKVWTSDITYLWTSEGWLYLAVIMDIYSRKIVGWSVSQRLTAEIINRALRIAVMHRNPPAGLIFHSDRGSQYTSKSFRELLKSYQMKQSMSSSGNCYDNAITESFFHTLKTELVNFEKYETREEARQSIFRYIEIFYNRQRLHSALGYLSPVELACCKQVRRKK
ncbi:IS3 family transposase [Melioribacter sp. Ez-97]|uniref:IS3 family transposase n=1 Tax=Melioribacter sp. Ez-97 TaxID=3423434 RepID=UPI003EDAB4F9